MKVELNENQSRIVTAALSAHSKWPDCDFCAVLRARMRLLSRSGGGAVNLSRSERILIIGCLMAERAGCGDHTTISLQLAMLEDLFSEGVTQNAPV